MEKLISPGTLEQDHNTITKILNNHRRVSTETMPGDVRFLWRTYLAILESAVSTLESLIKHMSRDR